MPYRYFFESKIHPSNIIPLKGIIFSSPHPFIFNKESVVIPGTLAFLVILVFAPFEFAEMDFISRLILSVMFGLISSFAVLMVIRLLKWIFPGFMHEESWTVGKEIILIFAVLAGICLLNFIAIMASGLSDMPGPELFQLVVLYTIAISIIPVAVLILFEQFIHQRKKLQQAQNLTKQLRKRSSAENEVQPSITKPIIFEAENNHIELQLEPNEIFFLNSDGNYVEVHYNRGGEKNEKKLIRNRLKHFIHVLPETSFFRCHKSYIVNKMHIIRVEGNARNLELIMRGSDQRIPVSRTKSETLSEFLKDD